MSEHTPNQHEAVTNYTTGSHNYYQVGPIKLKTTTTEPYLTLNLTQSINQSTSPDPKTKLVPGKKYLCVTREG